MAQRKADSIAIAGTDPPRDDRTVGRIVFNGNACRACRLCEVSCAINRFGEARPAVASINVTYDEFSDDTPIQGIVCHQCDDPACLAACPVEAISRHPETKAIMVDADKCIGCMRCQSACPWGIPKKHPDERLAIICNLCSDRPRGPVCLEVCPLKGQAISYQPIDSTS